MTSNYILICTADVNGLLHLIQLYQTSVIFKLYVRVSVLYVTLGIYSKVDEELIDSVIGFDKEGGKFL